MGGGLTSCFRSRLERRELTRKEMSDLMKTSGMNPTELNDWQMRFNNCYPYGYLTLDEFLRFYEEHQEEFHAELRNYLRDFFSLLDLNKDQKMDFYEFGRFYFLVHQGSTREKIDVLSQFYANEKNFSRTELKDLLRNLFYLFDLHFSHQDCQRVINETFSRTNLNASTDRIHWKQFTSVLLQFILEQTSSPNDDDDHPFLFSSQQF